MTRQLLLAFSPITLFAPSAGRAAGLKAGRLAGLWGKKTGVDLLDHIILGEDSPYSFARSGDLDAMRADYEHMVKRKA
jgi:hypothetical protein